MRPVATFRLRRGGRLITAPVRTRLRADLDEALRARDRHRVSVLRTLLADLANAEAVPPGAEPVIGRPAEAPRRRMEEADDLEVLRAHAEEVRTAIDEVSRVGTLGATVELRARLAVIEGYLPEATGG